MKGRRKVDLALQFHYVIGDVLAAIAAWTALYSYRKVEIENGNSTISSH